MLPIAVILVLCMPLASLAAEESQPGSTPAADALTDGRPKDLLEAETLILRELEALRPPIKSFNWFLSNPSAASAPKGDFKIWVYPYPNVGIGRRVPPNLVTPIDESTSPNFSPAVLPRYYEDSRTRDGPTRASTVQVDISEKSLITVMQTQLLIITKLHEIERQLSDIRKARR